MKNAYLKIGLLFSVIILGCIFFFLILNNKNEEKKVQAGYERLVKIEKSVSAEQVEKEISAREAAKQAKIEQEKKKLQQKLQLKDEQAAKKTKSFKKLFSNSVVLGDSIVEGLSAYNYLYKNNVIFHRGWSVAEANQLITTTISLHPQKVFMQFGINDMQYFRGNAKLFVKDYKKLVERLRKGLPDAEIYINSVLPTQSRSLKACKHYARWPQFNVELRKMCSEMKLPYIDNTSLVQTRYYVSDGLHMLPPYYPKWLAHMAEKAW